MVEFEQSHVLLEASDCLNRILSEYMSLSLLLILHGFELLLYDSFLKLYHESIANLLIFHMYRDYKG